MYSNMKPDLVPDKKQILDWIGFFCSMEHRRSGTENNSKSAQYIKDRFEEFGLKEVKIETPDSEFYFPREWSLSIDGENIDCYFINYSNQLNITGITDTGKIGAELVYVGEGGKEDFDAIDVKGKIVMGEVKWLDYTLRFFEENHGSGKSYWYDPHDTIDGFDKYIHKNTYEPNTFPWNYFEAMQRGALGFIGILSDNCDHYIHYCENYTEEIVDRSEEFSRMKIPGLWINTSRGQKIIEKLSQGRVDAEIRMVSEIAKGHANVISGVLPGKSDEIILVHSHHDACFQGAAQDASGMSIVLALAKYYSQIPEDHREKTLMFAAMDSHFSGYSGHNGFIRARKEEGADIILDFAIEHVAIEAVDDASNKEDQMVFTGQISMRLAYVTENRNLLGIVKDSVLDNGLERTQIIPVLRSKGDVCSDAHRFWREGIPVISFICPVIYLMDPVDTIDKVAEDQLEPVTTAYIEMIDKASRLQKEDFSEQENLNFFG